MNQTEDTQNQQEDQQQTEQTRAVRVPEKFTRRFILGLNADGDTQYSPLATRTALVNRIIATDPTPRGRGGMTREITVNREEYQELYGLLANARRYMQNVDKEDGKQHRANTLAAAVGADAACTRMEKDTIWGIDNPVPYVPKRKRKAKADTTQTSNDGADDSVADSNGSGDAGSEDGDLSSTYTPATVETADDTTEVTDEDKGFIEGDVANG